MLAWPSAKRRHLAPGTMISSPLAQVHHAPIYSDELAFSEEPRPSPDYKEAQKQQQQQQQQLATPHASSSTADLLSSSPRQKQTRTWPAKQTASPDASGAWLSIGRSSKDSEVTLPPSNRLISRRHAEVRYLRDEDALEVQCLGFNGLGVRIGNQALFVKRSCKVVLQLNGSGGSYHHQVARNVVLDIAGSLVVICPPPAAFHAPSRQARVQMDDDMIMPEPSSPVLEVIQEEDEEEDAFGHIEAKAQDEMDAEGVTSSAGVSPKHLEASSPPAAPLEGGLVTPTQSPARKKQRLLSDASEEEVLDDDSDEALSVSVLGDLAELDSPQLSQQAESQTLQEESAPAKILQPLFLQFSPRDNIQRAPTPPKKSLHRGKENTSPISARSVPTSPYQVHAPVPRVQPVSSRETSPSPAIAQLELAAEQEPVLTLQVDRDTQLHDAYTAAVKASTPPPASVTPPSIAEKVVVPMSSASMVKVKSAMEGERLDETAKTLEQTHVPVDTQEDGADPEFIDMILTTLASSTLSPTPVTYFTPFFPEATSLDEIENFLRTQACVAEVPRSGKDASGNLLRSEWYYEPRADLDLLRRSRLESLRKPIRGTRKVHHQYFWQPVALRKPLASSGLIEPRPRRKAKAKKVETGKKASS